jgi:3-oxoacyl-[acyl-carrier protein] reductase
MSKQILVAGASRGIGLAVAEHLVWQCDRLLSVSRTEATIGEWI